MYQVCSLQKEKIFETSQLIAESFTCGTEPTAYLVNNDKNLVQRFSKMIVEDCFLDGLCLSVEDKGRVVACLITSNLNNEVKSGLSEEMKVFLEKSKGYNQILEILEIAEKKYFKDFKRDLKFVSHPFYIAVSPVYFGKGLSVKMLNKLKELAKGKGYKKIYTECTNKFSTKVFQKVGAKIIFSMKYDEIMIGDGSIPLNGINEKICQNLKSQNLYVEERDQEVGVNLEMIEIDL